MRLQTFIISICVVASAASAQAESFTTSEAYRQCAALAMQTPASAEKKAKSLLQTEKSAGNYHCLAMAYYNTGRFEEAARLLAGVRALLPETDLRLRAYVLRQEARAWSEAGKPDAARQALSQVIDRAPMDAIHVPELGTLLGELLLDRAQLWVDAGRNAEAMQDLDHAIALNGTPTDYFIARAKLYTLLGDTALAKADLQQVLRVNPSHAEAVALMRELRE